MAKGAYMTEGMCGGGNVWQRGHVWQGGACMAGGMCGRGHARMRDGHKSERYASYWNAFLFVKVFDANIGNLVQFMKNSNSRKC